MAVFKKCGFCQKKWIGLYDFLEDSELVLIGYQQNIKDLNKGLFLFNHSCLNTLALAVSSFHPLMPLEQYPDNLQGTSQCQGYCLDPENLEPCGEHCMCAAYREIIQNIIQYSLHDC